jgi:hypothetical protein
MKTAIEWLENFPLRHATPNDLSDLIRAVQRDTLQHAADIAGNPANENYCGGSTGNARGTSMQIKSAIMAAMPNVES